MFGTTLMFNGPLSITAAIEVADARHSTVAGARSAARLSTRFPKLIVFARMFAAPRPDRDDGRGQCIASVARGNRQFSMGASMGRPVRAEGSHVGAARPGRAAAMPG